MSALTSLAWCANVASLRASRRAPSRAARARCAVVADAVTTGRAVWLAEDGRKDAPAGAFTQDFLFDLGVPQFPTDSFAPVNDVRFEAGSEAVAVTIERPLGIVFEEKVDGIYTKIVVDEIVPGSNAEKNGDVRVGDVLLITTAVFNVPASWTSLRGSTRRSPPTARRFSTASRRASTKSCRRSSRTSSPWTPRTGRWRSARWGWCSNDSPRRSEVDLRVSRHRKRGR